MIRPLHGLLLVVLLPLAGVVAAPANGSGDMVADCVLTSGESWQQIAQYIEDEQWELASELMDQVALSLANAAPFGIRAMALVIRPPVFCGDVVANVEPVYRWGDILQIYVEPNFYGIHCRGAFFRSHLRLGVAVVHEHGRTIWAQDPWHELIITAARPHTTAFFFATLDLGPGFPLGNYEAVLTITDILDEVVLIQKLPFVITY